MKGLRSLITVQKLHKSISQAPHLPTHVSACTFNFEIASGWEQENENISHLTSLAVHRHASRIHLYNNVEIYILAAVLCWWIILKYFVMWSIWHPLDSLLTKNIWTRVWFLLQDVWATWSFKKVNQNAGTLYLIHSEVFFVLELETTNTCLHSVAHLFKQHHPWKYLF